jgi:hypothetical protein
MLRKSNTLRDHLSILSAGPEKNPTDRGRFWNRVPSIDVEAKAAITTDTST